ncbi:protein Wnt-11b-2-like [Hemicordylus capensis]|uniref:protein Wnt-11b-2-like n=1 Tax=Hemicordylus capensis TaxID=884348 RepID=UPI0023025448|nr:protein Wnt-11b-2-like [Hemicordylus capensis]
MRFSPQGLLLGPCAPPAPPPLLLLLLALRLCAPIQWLGLAASGGGLAWNETQHCGQLDGLAAAAEPLAQLCRRHLELMPSVVQAARQTQGLCRKTFAGMRWNCSFVAGPRFAPQLLKGTRESAFVYALAAAAVSHAIARACASEQLPICSCGSAPSEEAPEPNSQWGGCGDNLHFGLQLGSAIADGAMKSSKAGPQVSRQVNLHNNEAGRQVLVDSMETKCKCHGVSGSCSVQTCWKSLPDLAEVAWQLKANYLAATKVTYRHVGSRKQLVPKDLDFRPLKVTELIYLISSPDYCVKNPTLGSLGTQDRHCNKSSAGSDSCNLLCCGRGYNAYRESMEERCQCKYYWCCYVLCKKCQRVVERYICK